MTTQTDDFPRAAPNADDPVGTLLATAAHHANAEIWSEAASCYQEALSIAPDCAEAAFGLGLIFECSGQHEAALRKLALAAELHPENGLYWRMLGIALSGSGEFDASLAAFEASLECDPAEEQTFLHIVESKFLLERFEDVVAAVNAMPLLQVRHPVLLILQASSLLALGQLQEARHAVRCGVGLFPDSAEMLAFAEVVHRGVSG